MTERAEISPVTLQWARERGRVSVEMLSRKFPRYEQWEMGVAHPTYTQLAEFANLVRAPFGALFMSEPPKMPLPLPDLRDTTQDLDEPPSVELLDTIHQCQRQQAWFQEYRAIYGYRHISGGNEGGSAEFGTNGERSRDGKSRRMHQIPFKFIGSTSTSADPADTANEIRLHLESTGVDIPQTRIADHLRWLVRSSQASGIHVMINGMLGTGKRRLNPDEFTGISIADGRAPLVFVNGNGSPGAQLYRLAHALALLWIGKSGVAKSDPKTDSAESGIGQWAAQVASRILVPDRDLKTMPLNSDIGEAKTQIARRFRVSTLVSLNRLRDVRKIPEPGFRAAIADDRSHERPAEKRGKGGPDFYQMTLRRIDENFAFAVISSTIEGQTLVGDALRLLDLKSTKPLKKLAAHVGLSF